MIHLDRPGNTMENYQMKLPKNKGVLLGVHLLRIYMGHYKIIIKVAQSVRRLLKRGFLPNNKLDLKMKLQRFTNWCLMATNTAKEA